MSGFERFTERARQVIWLAREEAKSFKHNYIGTEHILLGLLREEEGLGAKALAQVHLTIEDARAALAAIVPEGDEALAGQIPFTPRARKVCELALREALSFGHNYIGTEHVLLGLVRENEGVAARILRERQLDTEKVRSEVVRLLSAPRQRAVRQPPRPPDRIDAVLLVVRKFWEKNPDLRLGQLIGNAANQINCDPYAMEDDRLLAALWETWGQ